MINKQQENSLKEEGIIYRKILDENDQIAFNLKMNYNRMLEVQKAKEAQGRMLEPEEEDLLSQIKQMLDYISVIN